MVLGKKDFCNVVDQPLILYEVALATGQLRVSLHTTNIGDTVRRPWYYRPTTSSDNIRTSLIYLDPPLLSSTDQGNSRRY